MRDLLGPESQRFRLVRPVTEPLTDFRLSDCDWEALQIANHSVFWFTSTPEGVARSRLYPGPAGVTASAMGNDVWSRLAAANPKLNASVTGRRGIADQSDESARVDIIACPSIAVTRWSASFERNGDGLSGGSEVWDDDPRLFRRAGCERGGRKAIRRYIHG